MWNHMWAWDGGFAPGEIDKGECDERLRHLRGG